MFKQIALFFAFLAVAFAAPKPGVVGPLVATSPYAYSAGYVSPHAYSAYSAYTAPVAAAYHAAPVAAAYSPYAYSAYSSYPGAYYL